MTDIERDLLLEPERGDMLIVYEDMTPAQQDAIDKITDEVAAIGTARRERPVSK